MTDETTHEPGEPGHGLADAPDTTNAHPSAAGGDPDATPPEPDPAPEPGGATGDVPPQDPNPGELDDPEAADDDVE